MKNLKVILQLTKANLLMYIRDRGTLFWSLVFPFIIIGIFGLLDFAKFSTATIGILYDQSTQEYATKVKDILESVNDYYKVEVGQNLDSEKKALENSDRLLVLEFTKDSVTQQVNINAYLNKSNEQGAQVVFLLIQKVIGDFELQMNNVVPTFNLNSEVVNVFNLRTIDFMVPGVIAMSLMQGGIFGVVGTIVTYREKGILKRLFATPLSKSNFLICQILSRLVFSVLQVVILIVTSYLVFKIKIVGSLLLVALISVLGSLTFLSLGFVFSGISKTEESSRAIVMPIQMVLMFTGGVYFSRDVLPDWLFKITAFSPLTYLADMLRDIMTRGYSFADHSVQVATIGLLVWLISLILIAIRSFKWER